MDQRKLKMADLKNFPHYMLKEIYEQPRSIMDAVAHYLSPDTKEQALEEVRLTEHDIQEIRRINIVASGTSRHAGMCGEFMIERLARVPVEVDFASQYCYREPLTGPDELTVVLSQSGTTADTLAALREAKNQGAKTVAICNVRNTPITQESDGNIYTLAGQEVAIAATKSFTGQLVAAFSLALHLGNIRRALTAEETRRYMRDLMALPEKVEQALKCDPRCKDLAAELKSSEDLMFLGRDISYPIALEGALKVKETSYIHAEGFPTGEMKHGPSAMVDEKLPVIIVSSVDEKSAMSKLRHEKTLSLAAELVQRHARVVLVTNDAYGVAGAKLIRIPSADPLLSPVLEIIPLQLLAYHIAVMKGVDVDRPRNLSKSVLQE